MGDRIRSSVEQRVRQRDTSVVTYIDIVGSRVEDTYLRGHPFNMSWRELPVVGHVILKDEPPLLNVQYSTAAIPPSLYLVIKPFKSLTAFCSGFFLQKAC